MSSAGEYLHLLVSCDVSVHPPLIDTTVSDGLAVLHPHLIDFYRDTE
jgi:hypothetical protein